MPRTHQAFTALVQERLASLISAREVNDEPVVLEPFVHDVSAGQIRSIGRYAIAIVAVVACLVWLNRPTSSPVARTITQGIPLAVPSVSGAITTGVTRVVVDVEGLVANPGIHTLPAGSRVADAISAAGGVTGSAGTSSLNLAARLDDGQQIVVGDHAGTTSQSDPRVSLNSGSATDFDGLPGVGPVLAGRIVAWRSQHQHFSSLDQLQEVPGIGPKVFANLKSLVRL